MSSSPAHLALVDSHGRLRYALGDRLLNGGDVVELCCSGGFLLGRFDWSGDASVAPRFFFSIELGGGELAEQSIALPDGALLRRA